ncbi:probable elongation factor 1-delta isoform X1 [Macrosteles quadrilineatus]|uniref:probable elongation factor 1-delta isoform X1 n=1 Tax=Macrosteles quadrilineatus TaxID=74068 RepID=UPI0023E34A16|nr:probable elongation factor 1-delta isoform X1 [Macrosteles quadrilineatus]
MEVAFLAQEKVWFDKYKYEDAEKVYFENLSKLLALDGRSNKSTDNPKVNVPPSPATVPPSPAPPVVPSHEPITIITAPEPRVEDKRFKAKNRNRNKKDAEKKIEKPVKQEVKVSSNNPIMKNSLAEEVARARQHIKSSLECMDGIAKLSTDNMAAEITNRLKSLELENSHLKKDIVKLTELVKQLNDRVFAVEKSATGKSGGSAPVKAPAPAKAPANDDDDDGVDLFASESEDEDEEAKKIKEQRLAEYAARKSKKPVLIAKSNIILDVKPWDDETDMKKMEEEVRKITMDGLIWGASKLVPLAYGIQKLQISCVVEDDKVSVDDLQEQIEAIEDYVQSIDIAAFNKV